MRRNRIVPRKEKEALKQELEELSIEIDDLEENGDDHAKLTRLICKRNNLRLYLKGLSGQRFSSIEVIK